jgi:hypothetical protein
VLSSSDHKDWTIIRPILSDIKKIPYLQIYEESQLSGKIIKLIF